jgi:hypothetical protein
VIESTAMLLCIGGMGLLSFGQRKLGFAASAVGRVLWLFFSLGVNSVPLMLQSVAFLGFSVYGFANDSRDTAKR